jgi:hypothetical protein
MIAYLLAKTEQRVAGDAMYIHAMDADFWEHDRDNGTEISAPTLSQVEAAVRQLDGRSRTIVSLLGPGEAHLAIGGGSEDKYVAYFSPEDMSFRNAATKHDKNSEVILFIGGQDGYYPDHTVIDLDRALKVARTFALTGELDQCVFVDLIGGRQPTDVY